MREYTGNDTDYRMIMILIQKQKTQGTLGRIVLARAHYLGIKELLYLCIP